MYSISTPYRVKPTKKDDKGKGKHPFATGFMGLSKSEALTNAEAGGSRKHIAIARMTH